MRTTTLLPLLAAVLGAVAAPVGPSSKDTASASYNVKNFAAPAVAEKRVYTAARLAAVEEQTTTTSATSVATATAHPSKEALAHVESAKNKYVVRQLLLAAESGASAIETTTSVTVVTTSTASATATVSPTTKQVNASKSKTVHIERDALPFVDDVNMDDDINHFEARNSDMVATMLAELNKLKAIDSKEDRTADYQASY